MARRQIVDRLARPFQRFFAIEAASAIALLAATVIALIWANLPELGETYKHFWHTPLSLTLGDTSVLDLSLHDVVNEGLMCLFFFVVGMEIKRELACGELSTLRKALFPVMGALGGMIVPAAIYTYITWGSEALRGWGIPMATDIAFAVAAVTVLGSRVPLGLKVFLLALAIDGLRQRFSES